MSIHDELATFSKILSKLKDKQDPLFGAVEEYVVRQHCINAHLQAQISQIHNLSGFTGDSSVGVKKGDACPVMSDSPAENLDDEDPEAAEDVELDDQMTGDIVTLVEYMTELPLRA